MANTAALRRLKKEYASLQKEPAPGAMTRPLETNLLHAHFLLSGEIFYDTPYEGGVYHGVLQFPRNYPMKPPSVIMRTPSGRFQPNEKICFSLSDFHPELWNPMWSIRTILTGLVSFMNSDEITTGGLRAPSLQRIDLAKQSLMHCSTQDTLARELFGGFLDELLHGRTMLRTSWPPPRPIEPKAIEIKNPLVSNKAATPSPPSARKDQESMKMNQGKVSKAEEKTSQHPKTPCSGKSATKNKKRREREKRKKIAKKFMADLSLQVPTFLKAVRVQLIDHPGQIDVSILDADHVCWRTETMEEYTQLVTALRALPEEVTLLVESKVGGRLISTFVLATPIKSPPHEIEVVEIPAPKIESPYKSGLEHVEFVIGSNPPIPSLSPKNCELHQSVFEKFLEEHPASDWNCKARYKEVNPDIAVQIDLEEFGLCTVKFHLVPLSKVIDFEKVGNIS